MKAYKQLYLALMAAFLIGNHKGFIALWTDSGEDPKIVFPYSVTSLPPEDQQRVNEGIRVESEAQLHGLIEDFLS